MRVSTIVIGIILTYFLINALIVKTMTDNDELWDYLNTAADKGAKETETDPRIFKRVMLIMSALFGIPILIYSRCNRKKNRSPNGK